MLKAKSRKKKLRMHVVSSADLLSRYCGVHANSMTADVHSLKCNSSKHAKDISIRAHTHSHATLHTPTCILHSLKKTSP